MPRELFDMWMVPGIVSLGWEFDGLPESVAGTIWDGFFASKTPKWIANAVWRLTDFKLQEHLLDPSTKLRIRWIVEFAALGKQTPTANVHNSKERFWACTAYVREHSKLQLPVVGFFSMGDIEILDGNHRLAALLFLKQLEGFQLPIWLAVAPQ